MLPPFLYKDTKTNKLYYWPKNIAEWGFFFYQTYGIPPDITYERIMDKIKYEQDRIKD